MRFATHEEALTVKWKAVAAAASCTTLEDAAAAVAVALGLQCGGVDTWYNERSYDGRKGKDGRDDDNGRGW